jgi:hypothetical protein
MLFPDYPYRECKDCTSIIDCHNIEIIVDGRGTKKLPDDCPKKDEYEKVIVKQDL